MKKEGATFPKLKMRYYAENYRGVHSLSAIKKNETILCVPLKLMITLEMAYKSPIGKLMMEKKLKP